MSKTNIGAPTLKFGGRGQIRKTICAKRCQSTFHLSLYEALGNAKTYHESDTRLAKAIRATIPTKRNFTIDHSSRMETHGFLRVSIITRDQTISPVGTQSAEMFTIEVHKQQQRNEKQ